MIRIANTSRKHENGVGFSNGCAELTLKKPPPLVPSCLIAIWDAAGPTAIVCSVIVTGLVFWWPCASRTGFPFASVTGSSYVTGWRSAAVLYGERVATTP